jgi:hypothetical protein
VHESACRMLDGVAKRWGVLWYDSAEGRAVSPILYEAWEAHFRASQDVRMGARDLELWLSIARAQRSQGV